MQPSRRRKKRTNYGLRTVEVCRGKNGFGFTISGQQPCILSCIVPSSPAEQAGLRPGDYLIAVCGQNVSKVPHDDVVQLIGNCHGILKLQIAENYYSDSSEEDFVATIRQKPKYPNKYKSNTLSAHPFMHKSNKSMNNLVDDYGLDDEFEKNVQVQKKEPTQSSAQSCSNSNANSVLDLNCTFQCIVGYLGTIEMPKKLTPMSRLQVVRGCIKRLRAEKRNYTPVMMTVFPCSLRLKNESGTTIAVYPGGRVTFCSANNESNKKYFGIVTTSVSDEPSNSCHVFVMLSVTHAEHSHLAVKFNVDCSIASLDSAECSHFPGNCDPIVNAIRKYYEDQRNRNDMEEPLFANSPQPSNDSSVTTSNSDSGIGFRDDSGHQSDRILVVDIQNQRLHIQAAGLPDPQYIDCYAEKANKNNASANPSSLRSSLSGQSEKSNFTHHARNSESIDNVLQWTANQMFKGDCPNKWPSKSFEDVTAIGGEFSQGSLERRLSPKVFTTMSEALPVSQSLEDLKMQSELYEDLESSDNFSRKHSLQDLTSFSSYSNAQSQPTKPIENDRKVTCWATSLEKLLNDTVGLHAFAEFLKKEFSVENAYFWAACEKYRVTTNVEERRKLLKQINDRFLSNNAIEPVNVDSTGKNLTEQQLQTADIDLLQNAQKQIFNLMKFDSYTRFLKSDLYKNYLMREIGGEMITLSTEMTDPDLLVLTPASKTKSIKENTEEPDRNHRTNRRRRSLLPWTRSRAKSRDRTLSHENVSSCSGSHASLASWDLALPTSLCRIILPDSSSAVLNIHAEHTVYSLINKLLEKRAMPYKHFQVTFTATDEAVDQEENATVLSGKEVKVEWRIEFRLDLPNRKSLTIKTKPSHSLGAVLGPILLKHGYNLQMVTLCLMSENEVLEPSALVAMVDKQRVQVLTRSTPTPGLEGWSYYDNSVKSKPSSTLDEITNRVFEELLHGKSENYWKPNTDNVASTQSDDWSSEHSSRILGRFLRKDSFHQDKYRRNKKPAEDVNIEKKINGNKLPPVITKWRPSSKLDIRFEKDGLYEGLKRCQRGRLEDQRGTEINVELPEFLKDKENTPNGRKKMKKLRKEVSVERKIPEKETGESNVDAADRNAQNCGSSKIIDFPVTTDSTNVNFKQLRCENNIYANDASNFDCNMHPVPSLFKEPPPLPPKPKNISWRASTGSNFNYDPVNKSVYLDPTSSFV